MIELKTAGQIEKMRAAGRLSKQALELAGSMVREGITTKEIDDAVRKFILSQGGTPSFLGYAGYPASVCLSVNDEVIHGIPGKRVLKNGDIVSVDVGAMVDGWHGDNAWTFAVGEIAPETQKLLDVTRACLDTAISLVKPGVRLGDIGYAIQSLAESHGYGVVREFIGHGIGREMHEGPDVPNYGKPGRGLRLEEGMTIAIEPMINLKGHGVRQLSDGWTVVTASGSVSAHFENTIAVTRDGAEVLTKI
ncbi:MAG: type I methionyl aminopeptidase [Oscillospiraceae bacterium]|nr:type I methionyl aminopeptidase [Oscillospiraceae bacterium]